MYIKNEAARILAALDAIEPGTDEYDKLVLQLIRLGHATRYFPQPKGIIESMMTVQVNGMIVIAAVGCVIVAYQMIASQRRKKFLDDLAKSPR